MAESLLQKTVVITGAASGLGRALARRLATDGAYVAGLDRDEAGLQQAAAEQDRIAGELVTVRCNVTDAAECARVMQQVIDRWGGIDVLVNCAGITHRSLLRDTGLDVLRRVMEVNFFGAVNCTRAALPTLTQRRGVIVAVSSVAGFAPLIGRTGYCSSKHALHGFFNTLRTELEEDGVAVLLVCPSYIDTPMDQHALAGDGTLLRQPKVTTGRLLTSDEVVEAMVAAIVQRRRQILLSPTAKRAYWVSRLAPRLYDHLMLRTQRREFDRRG
jgi:NAD(P)-dependent dehydrogenase (short-subunit alcohol dehydrogenase family)